MSFLDNLLEAYGSGSSSSPRVRSTDPFAGHGQRTGALMAPVGVDTSRQAGFPNRIDVSPDAYTFKIGDTDVTKAVGLGAAAAMAPGYLRERPVAALDTLIGGVTGVKPIGELEKFVEGIPVLGPALGTLSNLVNGKALAGLLNGPMVGIASAYSGQSDSTPLPGQLHTLTKFNPVQIPGLRLPETVGELRKELYGRGILPEELDAVAGGTMSPWDFGDRAVSSNAWQSLITSLALDPTNALLFTPLGGVKAAALASRLGISATKAGAIIRGSEIFDNAVARGLARTALDTKQAAVAIARGAPAGEATLAGMSQFLKVVTRGGKGLADLGIGAGKTYFGIKGQVVTTAAPFAIDFLADHTDKGTPLGGFMENLRSFADQVENNRPLSENALFSMYSAMNFPLWTYAKQGWGKAVSAKNTAFGAGELDRFAHALGVKKADLVAWAGGHENVASFVDFIDEKIALGRINSHPLDVAYLGSMEEAIVRFAKTRDLTAAMVADMRAKGQIKMADRANAARDWYTAQGEKDFRGVRQQWDPELAMKQWGEQYLPLAQHLQPLLAQHGVTLGLNDASSALNSTLAKESIDGFLTMARQKAVKGYVAPRDLQALLDVVPLHKIGRKTEYWDRVFIRDAKPVSLKSLESKLGKLKAESPALNELLAGFTKRELDAPRMPGHVAPELGADALNNTLEGTSIGASRMRPELAAEVGLPEGATTLFEARVARSHPTVVAAERDVPKALAQAGFPVQLARRTFGGWEGGLEPSFVSVLSPSPIADVRLAASLAGHVLDQDAVLVRIAGKANLDAAGVKPNSRALQFANLPSAYADQVYSLASRAFPDGFTYDQVAGTLETIVPEAELATALARARQLEADLKAAIPQEAVGGLEVAEGSQIKVFAEWLERDAYGSVIDDAARAGDPRVYAFDAFSADLAGASERAANLSLSEGGSLGGGLGLGGSRLPRSPRDWGDVVPGEIAQAGRPASAAEELREAVDARGFAGDASYVSFARGVDEDVSSIFPLPKERVKPVEGREFFDLTPEEYRQPLTEAPTEVAPAAALVRFEQPAQDLAGDIQRAYDEGDIARGQDLNRKAGGSAESGGAVRDTNLPANDKLVSQVEHPAILAAAEAGEELGVRPGVQASIKDAPVEYLVRRDAETGEWVPLLSHAEALSEARSAGRAPLAGLHPGLRNMDPGTLKQINELEAWIRTEFPRYRLEPAPKIATGVKPKNARQVALSEYNALGEWLFNGGRGNVFSPVFNFMHWAATPVRNMVQHQAAESALMSEIISRGGKAEQVETFLSLARKEADAHDFGKRGVKLFRDWSSLPANTINRLAVEAGFPATVTDALGEGRFHLLIDRATSRYYRSLQDTVLKGGKRGQIARGLSTVYDEFQSKSGVHYLYDVERATAKVWYHVFRFLLDPRWWAMNLLEADILNAARYGIKTTRFGGQASKLGDQAAFVHGQGRLPTQGELSRSTKKGQAKGNVPAGQKFLFKDEAPGHYSGWNDNRNLAAYIIKAFDVERASSTGAALRNLGENHPVITALRDRFGEDVETWVRGVDDTMYRFDTLGVKGTIDDAARELEAQGLMSIPEMRPFIEQIYNRNQQLYDDIVRNLHGNAHRTNAERMLNSYWLYWPISYQLKAGKWLLDVLTHKLGGRETNLGGLYAYERLREKHMELMARDDEYAAVFDENPELWFAAQMMLPITPQDVGISLSRPVRYGLSFSRDVAGGDQGPLAFLTHYKTAEDPVLAAQQILAIGPIYTKELIGKIWRDIKANDNTTDIEAHL